MTHGGQPPSDEELRARGGILALAARLRAILDLSQVDLAAALGADPRALAAGEPAGPAAAALRLLAEVPRGRAPAALAALARASGASEAEAAALEGHVARSLEELGGRGATLRELCDAPVEWAWWAPADAGAIRALADELGLLPRSLLRGGAAGSAPALDVDLFAPRAGDPVLLCLGGAPETWYQVAQGETWPQGLRTPHPERLRLAPALPPVLRYVPASGPAGKALAAAGCRLADGRAAAAGAGAHFAGLSVKPLAAPLPAGERIARPARSAATSLSRLREAR
ncbi:hypothetical protein [Anaeromyxobacter paludicola]|uniref:HTH cro/C1-type domain-containing protein n=1 Tax=Anaeromyxobacter paludicola TaxID=2918171 RepID=A0ABM7XAA1_9BACT|nr:hypothetical protein [Anaeromyxobacter paludicola]BDG08784.1 hypothetical protein AMPC_18970 [Anaeromyxobacter paludicola]